MKKIKTISILVFVFTVFIFSSAITQTNMAMAKTNTSNATTAVYGHPVLENVTRDKDHSMINVDDFGFDVSQYENVTIFYLFDNGTGTINDVQLEGSYNGWNYTDSNANYNLTYTGTNNGTTAWKIYSITMNITSISVIEFKARAFGGPLQDQWTYGENVPGNNNHRIVVNGATIISSFVVNAAGDVITNYAAMDFNGGPATDIVVTASKPTLLFLVVNVSNSQPTQIFGVGNSYIPKNGSSGVYNWDVHNGVFNQTLTTKFGTGTTTQRLEYWTTPLMVNSSIRLEYKAMMNDTSNTAGVQYEPGMGPNNHVLNVIFADEVATPVTNTVTTTVNNTVVTTTTQVSTSVSTSVDTTTKSVTATTTTVSSKSSPGFEVISVLLASGAFVLVFSVRRRRNN